MLSRDFLVSRGYCCGHGCLMCPYEPKHIEGNTTMSDKKGTYFEIERLEQRIVDLENTIKEFMSKWGPEVQERRDKRDEVWDEMVRVISIQDKHKGK